MAIAERLFIPLVSDYRIFIILFYYLRVEHRIQIETEESARSTIYKWHIHFNHNGIR